MPESKGRKKPKIGRRKRAGSSDAPAVPSPTGRTDSPRWWAPTMVTLLIVGLLWIVVFYISQQSYPIPGLGLGNLGIGFAIAMIGFGMTTRWR